MPALRPRYTRSIRPIRPIDMSDTSDSSDRYVRYVRFVRFICQIATPDPVMSATLGKSPPNPVPCRGATNPLDGRKRERGAR
ncbi:MAG: hypothetical protein RBT25_10240 [Lentisphaeria bacterium]|nr:hypothetical protein [Lentisphaeria bacterium]